MTLLDPHLFSCSSAHGVHSFLFSGLPSKVQVLSLQCKLFVSWANSAPQYSGRFFRFQAFRVSKQTKFGTFSSIGSGTAANLRKVLPRPTHQSSCRRTYLVVKAAPVNRGLVSPSRTLPDANSSCTLNATTLLPETMHFKGDGQSVNILFLVCPTAVVYSWRNNVG